MTKKPATPMSLSTGPLPPEALERSVALVKAATR